MTREALIQFLFIDTLLAMLLLITASLLFDWVRHWKPSGDWGLTAELVKIGLSAVILFALIILLAENYNFWIVGECCE